MANNEGFSTIGTLMSFTTDVPATNDLAGMAALTYTPWDRLENIGDVGPEDEEIEWVPVSTGVVEKIQSVRNNGMMDMTAADVPDNPGQIVFVTAQGNRTVLSVKEELPTGEILYFRATPLSARKGVGDAKGMLKIMPKMSVTGDIFADITNLN